MGKAFQCDLCDLLEAGEPLVTFTVKGIESRKQTDELFCSECTQSYTQWRDLRVQLRDIDDA